MVIIYLVPDPSGILSSPNGPSLPMSSRRQHSMYTQSQIEVIDLTDSPPQPSSLAPPRNQTFATTRPSRDVIDLDSLPDPPNPPPHLPLPQQLSPYLYPPRPQYIHPMYLPGEDITRNHDVITLGDDTSPPPPPPPPPPPALRPDDFGFLTMLRHQFLGSATPAPITQEVTHVHYHIHHRPPPRPTTHFVPPGRLNFNLNGHNMYPVDETPLRDHPGFKDDTYSAPPAPREGFTRSPRGNMALICPCCGDELGKHVDLVKKEVWVAKCGHTYCGSCAAVQRQNRAKGPKVGRCLVDGCTRIISGDKGMMEVFL
jgi:hypothetical protein